MVVLMQISTNFIFMSPSNILKNSKIFYDTVPENSKERRNNKDESNYRVVAVLDLSTPVPFPHPGFCLLAKFWST